MFWTLHQNNSGGKFHYTDDLDHYIAIEADNAEEATEKAYKLTEDSSYDWCECCGERWYISFYDDEGSDVPEIYSKSIYSGKCGGSYSKHIIVHFKDGRKHKVDLYTGEVVWEK